MINDYRTACAYLDTYLLQGYEIQEMEIFCKNGPVLSWYLYIFSTNFGCEREIPASRQLSQLFLVPQNLATITCERK